MAWNSSFLFPLPSYVFIFYSGEWRKVEEGSVSSLFFLRKQKGHKINDSTNVRHLNILFLELARMTQWMLQRKSQEFLTRDSHSLSQTTSDEHEIFSKIFEASLRELFQLFVVQTIWKAWQILEPSNFKIFHQLDVTSTAISARSKFIGCFPCKFFTLLCMHKQPHRTSFSTAPMNGAWKENKSFVRH